MQNFEYINHSVLSQIISQPELTNNSSIEIGHTSPFLIALGEKPLSRIRPIINPGSIPPDIILDYVDIPYSAKMRVKEFFEAMQKQGKEVVRYRVETECFPHQPELDIERQGTPPAAVTLRVRGEKVLELLDG